MSVLRVGAGARHGSHAREVGPESEEGWEPLTTSATSIAIGSS